MLWSKNTNTDIVINEFRGNNWVGIFIKYDAYL